MAPNREAKTIVLVTASPFARRGVAFVGGTDHAPNQDAVRWLTEAIMPLVWKHDPRIPCLVVGSGWGAARPENVRAEDSPDVVRARLDRRVNLVGHVGELDSVFNQVRLTVAPLRF